MKGKNHYFEGWYIKNTTEEHMLILIPGLSVSDGKKEAFLQVILDGTSYFISYDANRYKTKRNGFYVQIAGNIFTRKGCRLCIHTEELSIDGILRFGKFNPLAYSIMGPLELIPNLACKHTVISMDHALYGSVTINGDTYNFKGGRGYIEGDRGVSFPDSYFWSQCNHFKRAFTSVMAAVAEVPLFGHTFLGTTIAVLYKGKEYRMATYLGAKVRLYTKKRIIITQNNMILKVTLCKANPVSLAAPINGAMIRTIEEHTVSQVHYYFAVKGKILIDETCDLACQESSFINKVIAL